VLVEERDAALALDQHAHQRLQGGRLAGAVAAHQRDDLAAVDLQGHVEQDVRGTVPDVQPAGLQKSGVAHAVTTAFFSKVLPLPKYTSCTFGWSRISAGLPSAVRGPRASTSSRSAYANTTSMLCSVNSTARPRSVTSFLVRAISSLRSFGAMPA